MTMGELIKDLKRFLYLQRLKDYGSLNTPVLKNEYTTLKAKLNEEVKNYD